eukprot:9503356-Pyramimonas_sp.AAC.1
MHGHVVNIWFRVTSQARRWHPSDGAEWALLRCCKSFTEAHHVLRILSNGLPGSARRRGVANRLPRRCACGAPAKRVWLTAGQNGEGEA